MIVYLMHLYFRGWGEEFLCVVFLGLYWGDYKNMHIKYQFYNKIKFWLIGKTKNKPKNLTSKPAPSFSYLGQGKIKVYERWSEKFWSWKHWGLLLYTIGDWLTKTSCNSIWNCWKRISLFRFPHTKSIKVFRFTLVAVLHTTFPNLEFKPEI